MGRCSFFQEISYAWEGVFQAHSEKWERNKEKKVCERDRESVKETWVLYSVIWAILSVCLAKVSVCAVDIYMVNIHV